MADQQDGGQYPGGHPEAGSPQLGAGSSEAGARKVGAPEVGASAVPEGDAVRPAFVLHEHRRPRHHFDLRLEEDGVLRSWAVPRGLPTSSGQNRLAVQVGDHELAHLTYQDADKSIADIGWWEEIDRNDRRLVFILHGNGAAQRYALIRTSSDWLLHRTKEQPEA
jgi:DNA ligase D-like protein (predicted 3'-phosphoesterase)